MTAQIEQLITAYVDGTLLPEERQQLLHACQQDPEILRLLSAHRGLAHALAAQGAADPDRTWVALDQALAQDTESRRWRTVERMERALPKRSPFMLWFAVAACLMLAAAPVLWWGLAEQPISPASNTVILLESGPLQIQRGGQVLQPHTIDTLQSGDRIRSGPGTRAVLRIDEAAQAVVYDEAELLIEGNGAERVWRLEQGQLRAHLDPTEDPGSLRVTTPHLQVDVVGTAFHIDVDKTSSRLEVLSGAVAVSAPEVDGQKLTAGKALKAKDQRSKQSPALAKGPTKNVNPFPHIRPIYAAGRFALDPHDLALRPLWPVTLDGPNGGLELTNAEQRQKNHTIAFGGCVLEAFALTFDAEIVALDSHHEFAVIQHRSIKPTNFKKLNYQVKPGVINESGVGQPRPTIGYRIVWRHIGYVVSAGLPVYESITSIDGTVLGHGLVLGAPRSFTLGLRGVRARISNVQIHAVDLPPKKEAKP